MPCSALQAPTVTESQDGEDEISKNATPVEDSPAVDEIEAGPMYEAAEVMHVSVSVADLRQGLLKERQRVQAAKEATIAASIKEASFAASSLQVPTVLYNCMVIHI